MRILIVSVLVVLLAGQSFAMDEPKNESQKTLYAIGLIVSRSLAVFNLTPEELEFVKQGITDSVSGKTTVVELKDYNGKVQELARERRKVKGEKLAIDGKKFLDQAAKENGAVKTESGMVYFSLKEGNGASPEASDTVKVNYRGTFVDGKEFDSSYKKGAPAELRLNGVIKCWTEGLQKMKPGGKAKLVCPPSLAYGESGAGDVMPPNATLVFEVELLEVKKQEVKKEEVKKPEAKKEELKK